MKFRLIYDHLSFMLCLFRANMYEHGDQIDYEFCHVSLYFPRFEFEGMLSGN